MWPFRPKQEYHPVARNEDEQDVHLGDGDNVKKSVRGGFWPYSLGCAILLLAGIAITVFVFFPHPASSVDSEPQENGSPRCSERREWRTLKSAEQQEYIAAVKCLQSLPSTVSDDPQAAAYDDFPWMHSHVGYATHNSAPFLPWHRYFLHVYHQTLKNNCSYSGELIYWDWTLDSDALEKSPVFDPHTGFGGDGDVNWNITVGRSGRCVVDGPFAGTQVSFYDVKYQPHCLSRGFRDLEGNPGHIDGRDISPDSIEGVLSIDNYEDFVAAMESKVHDAIPFGIAGDFETFTAPYDPIFFLHHTQLDRLWYLWQERQPGRGLEAYSGRKARHSLEMASLDDDLRYPRLAPSVKVKDIMDVENELLCYRY